MKILIVKLGAMGDVLRTTPLLRAYKKRYPQSRVTWVVECESRPVLAANPQIDRLLDFSPETLGLLARESFDLAINLDKEREALDAIEAARCSVKKGFGWNAAKSGLAAINPASEYALRLGIDDKLKFRSNQKTYQEISFEQAEMVYENEEYLLTVTDEERRTADKRLHAIAPGAGASGRGFVGINTGSGDRFAGKRLPVPAIADLAREARNKWKLPVLLLGGPKERERNLMIERTARPYALDAGTDHPIGVFAAIVERCALVFTGDTIALHVAIATRTPVVSYFGSTCAPEIELYGRGRKIVSGLPCAPCYKRVCPIDDQCMSEIAVEKLIAEGNALLAAGAAVR